VVRYCWLLIAIAAVVIGYNNGVKFGIGSGLVSGGATVLVGVVVWIVLRGVLQIATIWMSVTRAIKDAQQMQESIYERYNGYSSPYTDGYQGRESEKNVVEGTIVEVEDEPEQEQKQ
jgi:hypothetical protein